MSNVTYTTTNIGGFRPTQISGCQIWLDAADSTTIATTGSTLDTWTDKASSIPFGRKNGTGVTYSNSLVNLASSSFLKNNSGSITIGQTFTVFLVASNTSGSQAAAIYLSSLASGQPGVYIEWTTTTNYRFLYRFPVGVGGGTNVFIPVTSGVVPLTIGTFYRVVSGANYQLGMGINASLTPTTVADTSSGPLGTCNQLAFGTNYQSDVVADRPLTGSIAEIIVYNAELTTAQREQVEGYLAWKWGLQSNLPNGHPYTSIPTFSYSPGFAPPMLDNNIVWVDAADNSTATFSGSTFNSIGDKSQTPVSYDQGSTKPLDSNPLNGRVTMNFSAVSSANGISANNNAKFNSISQFSLFVVNRPTYTAPLGYDAVMFSIRDATTTCFSWHQNNNYGAPLVWNGTSVGNSGLSVAQNELHLFEVVQGASSFIAYKNGNAASSVSYTVTGRTGLPANVGNNRITGSEGYRGQIGEVVMYSRTLSEFERTLVEGYLAWKWGLQTSLPAAHPYRNRSVFYFPTFNPALPLAPILRPAFFTNPGSLATLQYWFDASDPTTITGTGVTLAMTNKGTVGAGGNLSRNAGTPTTYTVFQNGRNLIGLAAGASLVFTTQFTPNNQPRTRFFATRPTVANPVVFFYQGNASISGNDYCAIESGGTYEIAQGNTVTMQTATVNHSNTFQVYTFRNAATAANNRIAFTGAPQSLSFSVSAQQYNINSVATYINIIGTNNSAQDFGELLSYSSELTEAQTQTIEGYLAWKWGVQGSLPATHPFRLFPPPP